MFHSDSLGEWLSYLEALHPSEIELGLDRVLTVYRRLELGQIARKTVIIGGTNGKGTTLFTLEQLLRSRGLSVGCYTSPHITRFNERIRINAEDVGDHVLLAAFKRVEQARKSTSLTYFEFTTLAALVVFAEAGLDYVLLEVGLGGRLDAVNIADPDLSIITSVDLDHQDWLGDTRELIGYEKAGILRQGVPALYGEYDPPNSVTRQAFAQSVPLMIWGEDYGIEVVASQEETESPGKPQFLKMNSGELINLIADETSTDKPASHSVISFKSVLAERLKVTLDWAHLSVPVTNLATAIQAFLLLEGERASGVAEVLKVLPSVAGRFESNRGDSRFRFDVAHNRHAAHYLRGMVQLHRPKSKGNVVALFSALRDKDISGIVEELEDVITHWVTWALDSPRAASASVLKEVLFTQHCRGIVVEDAMEAVQVGAELAGNQGLIVVFGSFYTVSEVKAVLDQEEKGVERTKAK